MSLNPDIFFKGIFVVSYLVMIWQIACRYLQFYQQEEYDSPRFIRWWISHFAIEKRAALFTFLISCLLLLCPPREGNHWFFGLLIIFVLPVSMKLGWSNKPTIAKKPLVMTSRAKRILYLALLLPVFILSGIFFITESDTLLTTLSACFIIYPVLILLTPIFLIIANLLLSPFEWFTKNKYASEARKILRNQNPFVIGITGSYGKTSIKHILDHILNSYTPTLATPGSVNTQMGITRIIRERLRPNHTHFIVEMGAYGIGSIRRLCDFTPPKAALVTAVGYAHYERFKSIETVTEAKSELVQALPEDGIAVLNGDDPNCRKMALKTKAHVIFYGRLLNNGALHCRLVSDQLTPDGLQCDIEYMGKNYSFTVPIYGKHQALNATGAFLLAVSLGVPAITAIAALKTVPSINHRLAVQKGADGITMIDDAYNSNPAGFRNALDVLQILPGNRKILVTPGMVELGNRMDEEHALLGEYAATICSDICLIAAGRIRAFKEALLKKGFLEQNLHEFTTLNDAREWMKTELKPGDVVLFENDLPDLYETAKPFFF